MLLFILQNFLLILFILQLPYLSSQTFFESTRTGPSSLTLSTSHPLLPPNGKSGEESPHPQGVEKRNNYTDLNDGEGRRRR
jgi:hypothetical protein